MDNSTAGLVNESDISESWTLIDKESIEPDNETSTEDKEAPKNDTTSTLVNEDQNTCSLCESADGLDSVIPELLEKSSNEGGESFDSDGISIISESEEEEELQLLPCNPPSVTHDQRPSSKSSNKYFDDTDTSSQCSSRAQDLLGAEQEKKYVHQPNSGLNTSLNVLLVISCAAVLGLGMGHFLGLQEECSNGYVLEEKVKDNVQNEELSTLMLKKLELENKALKEQFANLQMVIEEIRKNSSSCSDEFIPGKKAENSAMNDNEILDDITGAKCDLPVDSQRNEDLEEGDVLQENQIPVMNYDDSGQAEESLGDEERVASDGPAVEKAEIFPRLEQSLENIAALFIDRVNGEKFLPEGSREALDATFSVFSTLMENLQEKLGALKKSMDEGTLTFDVPFQAISKMEEVIQKTSQKIQKVTESAIKEGKPLFSISDSVSSKLQSINKKLERKWCQIKKNMSKQSVILSWLDDQIFNNCSEGDAERDENVGEDVNPSDSGLPTKRSEERKGAKYYGSDAMNEKFGETEDLGKKSKGAKNEDNFKMQKPKSYRNNNDKFEKYKDKRNKRSNYVDPNSFDFDHVPSKGRRDESPPRLLGEKRGGKPLGGIDVRDEKGGEWVEALFNSRAERRRDERRSDWIFARARSRNKQRELPPSRSYYRKKETRAER